jgi:uncharacterized MAPEG superfamily protein
MHADVTVDVPVLVLLGFAAWTLLTLVGSIGVYRWSRIFSGRTSIAEWYLPHQGDDWYQRAKRAHMNCIENLPIYTAIVVALMAIGLRSSTVDYLAIAILPARIGQTLTHILLPPTNVAASIRFGFYSIQLACMISLGALAVAAILVGTA